MGSFDGSLRQCAAKIGTHDGLFLGGSCSRTPLTVEKTGGYKWSATCICFMPSRENFPCARLVFFSLSCSFCQEQYRQHTQDNLDRDGEQGQTGPFLILISKSVFRRSGYLRKISKTCGPCCGTAISGWACGSKIQNALQAIALANDLAARIGSQDKRSNPKRASMIRS
jgi:hypothetical protein